MCSCQGALAGFLRSIPAVLLLSQSSLALCCPSLSLPKERGLGLQDPAPAPQRCWFRAECLPLPCAGGCACPFPPGFWSTSAPVPWLEGLCRALPTSDRMIPHHTLLDRFIPELIYFLSGFTFQLTLTLTGINIADPPVTDFCVSTLGFLIPACPHLDLLLQEDVHTLLFVRGTGTELEPSPLQTPHCQRPAQPGPLHTAGERRSVRVKPHVGVAVLMLCGCKSSLYPQGMEGDLPLT